MRELRALFLRDRAFLEQLPPMGQLLELQALDLAHTQIRKLPSEIGQLPPFLRSLNLSGTSIRSLPLSLTELRELRTLLLRDCTSLAELLSLGQLTELQELDLSGTQISELPCEIGQMNKLKQLYLSRTLHLSSIKAGTVSRLSSLEVFDASLSAYTWDVEGKARSTIEELASLMFLSVLYIRKHSIACLALDFSWLKRLRRFHICIGSRTYVSEYPPMPNNERSTILGGVDLSGEAAEVLLSSTSELAVDRCKGLSRLSGLVRKSNFNLATLKSIQIVSCGITSVIKGEDVHGSMLPNLEELDLDQLRNLKNIWEGVVPNGNNLRKLRALRVGSFPSLESLISYDLLPQLENLEEIKVSNCNGMDTIFAEKVVVEVAEINEAGYVYFKNILKRMKPNGESIGKLRTIKVAYCMLLNSLISYDLLRQLKNLEEIEVRNCDQMKEIITTEVADGQASHIIKEEENAIPKLRILKLFNLEELIHVYKKALPMPWQNIEAMNCPMLQKDLSLSLIAGSSKLVTGA